MMSFRWEKALWYSHLHESILKLFLYLLYLQKANGECKHNRMPNMILLRPLLRTP